MKIKSKRRLGIKGETAYLKAKKEIYHDCVRQFPDKKEAKDCEAAGTQVIDAVLNKFKAPYERAMPFEIREIAGAVALRCASKENVIDRYTCSRGVASGERRAQRAHEAGLMLGDIKACRKTDVDPKRPSYKTCLYAKRSGKLIGRHRSRASALRQEQAIQIRKHR